MRDYDGKTAAERVAQRREQLVEAGLEVFGVQGYSKASMRAILEQAGLRPRYFAENFADLDELMAAVLDRVVDGEVTRCRAAAAAAASGTQTAQAVISAIMDYLEADPRRARIKLREAPAAGPISRRHRQLAMQRIAAMLVELLLPPVPADSGHDPQALGLALAAAGYELMADWLDGQPGMTREQVIRAQMLLYEGIVHQLTFAPQHR